MTQSQNLNDELLKQARNTAADVLDQSLIEKCLGKTEPFENIKEKVRRSRKPRMRTVEQYLCDNCNVVIDDPNHGFIVQGNIYVADPSCRGGLIGNNIVEKDNNISKVEETVFCITCFLAALGLEDRGTAGIVKTDVSPELKKMIDQARSIIGFKKG